MSTHLGVYSALCTARWLIGREHRRKLGQKSTGAALTMASAKREPIMGVWSGDPSGVQGQSPWTGGQGAKPPEAESFLRIGHPKEGARSTLRHYM